jgi:hypothetical protein
MIRGEREMNRQQLESLHRVFCRDPDGAQSFLEFRRRAMRCNFRHQLYDPMVWYVARDRTRRLYP